MRPEGVFSSGQTLGEMRSIFKKGLL